MVVWNSSRIATLFVALCVLLDASRRNCTIFNGRSCLDKIEKNLPIFTIGMG